MNLDEGIHVDWLDQPRCIRMIWGNTVTERDVRLALAHIQELLNEATDATCVIVDLTREPSLPLGATLQGALAGPYRHAKLRSWLIIEANPNRMAHIVERLLSGATGRQNVLWFATEAEALDAVKQGTVS